ncbi:hypothetical protein MSAN_01476500 [Mycena sanguinolenta]|uniref:DUF1772-domain-containing protein n=1 Tax=Mycena sanguinolenta TaxID=230812 RepID=A0A8H6Y7A1_9AGAR|nr:hypothetical protein MSAN_01476500 [Mycena sanguinolenta]
MPAIALIISLVSSSYFTFSNIGAAYAGSMALTERGRTTLSVVDRLTLWDGYYNIAKFHMGGSTVVAGASLCWAASLTPAGTLRNILVAGGIAGFAVAIYTVLRIRPVNSNLMATLRDSRAKPMDAEQEEHVLNQLDKWRAMHRVRIVLGIVSWLAATTGILANGPFISF